MDDRNLDNLDVLRNTAGVTFRRRGWRRRHPLARLFTCHHGRFRSTACVTRLFTIATCSTTTVWSCCAARPPCSGRGSTGGAVNQVSKVPKLITEHDVTTTVGSHGFVRATGDFNIQTGESAALRINAMANKANNGAGSSIDKKGIAAAYRFGIGERDEFLSSLYSLDNNNGINYGLPWVKPKATDSGAANTIIGSLAPTANFGMASDRSAGTAQWLALKHTHRFDASTELQTQVRKGQFTRDSRPAPSGLPVWAPPQAPTVQQ